MPTEMNEADWKIALEVFRVCLPARGAKAWDDRSFLEALHYFTVHNISWRALPDQFGKWNSVWKRFNRLSKAGVFEDFFVMLPGLSDTAHLVQMFDSTIIRAHVSAARCRPQSRQGSGRTTEAPDERCQLGRQRGRASGFKANKSEIDDICLF